MKQKWQKISDGQHMAIIHFDDGRDHDPEHYKHINNLEIAEEFMDDVAMCLKSFLEIEDWMKEINVDSFDKYKSALNERLTKAREILLSNSKDSHTSND